MGHVSDVEVAEGVRLAKQAIEAGKEDPDTLWMAAYTLSFFGGEHVTAASVIDRALTLNPNSAHAWMASGWVSVRQNQPDRAIPAFEHGMRLSPLDPLGRAFTIGLAAAHLAAGRYEEAAEWADRTLGEEPRHRPAMRIKAVCYAYLGRMEEARDWANRVLELDPGFTIARLKASVTFLPPEILAVHVGGLRKAGLPEG